MVGLIKRLAVRFRPDRVDFGAMCLKRAEYLKGEFDRLPAGHPTRSEVATSMLETLIDGLGGFVGTNVLQAAYLPSPPVGASREDHLSILWFRLWVAERLFKTLEHEGDQASVKALRNEVLAVANGDAPILLDRLPEAGKQGLSPARYRVLGAKMEILQWKHFIKNHCTVPIRVNVFESWVKLGFNSSEANKWKTQVGEGIGRDNLALGIALSGDLRFRLPIDYDAADVEREVRASVAALRRAEQLDRAKKAVSAHGSERVN